MPAQPKTTSLAERLHSNRHTSKKSNLKTLINQSQRYQSVESIVLQAIPISLQETVRYLSHDANTLSLQCSSAAVGARLRMLSTDIYAACAQGLNLQEPFKLTIKIRPASFKPEIKTKQRTMMSEACKASIRECAESIGDEGISNALNRIAK